MTFLLDVLATIWSRSRDKEHQKMLTIESHPLLDLRAFVTTFSDTLGNLTSSGALVDLLSLDASAPLQSSDEVRLAVRNLLRQGGFKPTGRSKPVNLLLCRGIPGRFLLL